MHARSLRPLVKTRAFGMTPELHQLSQNSLSLLAFAGVGARAT